MEADTPTEARFGTNLVWLEITALAFLIALLPSPALLLGGIILIWGTACGIGRYTARMSLRDAHQCVRQDAATSESR